MLWGSWLISSHADISAISWLLLSAYLCHAPKDVVGLPCWYVSISSLLLSAYLCHAPKHVVGLLADIIPCWYISYQLSITISSPLSCPQSCCGALGWYPPMLIYPLSAAYYYQLTFVMPPNMLWGSWLVFSPNSAISRPLLSDSRLLMFPKEARVMEL